MENLTCGELLFLFTSTFNAKFNWQITTEFGRYCNKLLCGNDATEIQGNISSDMVKIPQVISYQCCVYITQCLTSQLVRKFCADWKSQGIM